MKKVWILILTAMMTACYSPNPHFFQPTAVSQADTTYPSVTSTILLNQVLLPAEVSRPQITTLGKEQYELKIDEFNRWGAAPEKLIQRVLNQNLAAYLPNANIENQTPLRKNYQYAVMAEVLEMSGRLDDFATLKASYFIKNKQNRIVKSGKFDMTVKIDGDYDEYVPAQSALLNAFSAEIAGALSRLK